MAIGHWFRAWKRQHETDRRTSPVRRPRPFRPLESLEDRSVPAVTVLQDPLTGILTVNTSAAGDAFSISGTNLFGDGLIIAGTGIANPINVSGVTGLVVNDTSGSASANAQSVTFLDQVNGTIFFSPVIGVPGTGRLDITGIETVNFFSQRRPLVAESGIAVSQAQAITLRANAFDWGLQTTNSPISLEASNLIALEAVLKPGSGNVTLTTAGTITDTYVPVPGNTPVDRNAIDTTGTLRIVGTGPGVVAGSATDPLSISAGNLQIETSANNGSVFISLDPVKITTTLQTGSINMGTGTLHLIAPPPLSPTSPPAVSSLFMAGPNVFNDAITIDLAVNTNLDVRFSDTIGGLTGVGTVTTTADPPPAVPPPPPGVLPPVSGRLLVGGNNTSSTFDGRITDGVRGGTIALAKVGTGTFTMTGVTGTNTYSAGTILRDGQLKFSANGRFGSGDITIGDAGTPAGHTPALTAVPTGGTLTLSNAITVNVPNAILGSDHEAPGTISRLNITGGVTLNLARDQALVLQGGFVNPTEVGNISGFGNLRIVSTDLTHPVGLRPGNSFTNAPAIAGGLETAASITIEDGSDLLFYNDLFTSFGITARLYPNVHFATATSRLLPVLGRNFMGAIYSDTPGAGQIVGFDFSDSNNVILIVGFNNESSTFDGPVTEFTGFGPLQFYKTGLGTLNMNGAIDITGLLLNYGGGQLYLNGTNQAARIDTDGVGSYLGGTGTFTSPVFVYNSGSLRPGDATNYQTFTPSTLLFGPNAAFPDPSELAIKLDNSATLGLRHDAVNASGIVDITGATLLLIPGPNLAANPIPAGTVIPIVTSPAPIIGQFSGLPDGSTVQLVTGGQLFLIRYQANQITLTAVLPPIVTLTAPDVTNISQPNPYLFTVTYESALGIDASTFGNNNVTVTLPDNTVATATFVSSTPPGNGNILTATYSMTPPGGSWDPTDTGTYTVRSGSSPVGDSLGLRLDVGVTFGTFTANLIPDTAPPTATVTAPNVTPGNAPNPYLFTVDFADATAVDATTFGDDNFTVTAPDGSTNPVTFVSAVPGGNGSPITATYAFVPPGGAWGPSNLGNYAIIVGTSPVADTVGNSLTTGSPIAVFNSTFGNDGLPPTTVLNAPPVTLTSSLTSYAFTVDYTDPTGFNFSTFATNNVAVAGPNGFTAVPTLAFINTAGTTVTATYLFTPPGGNWDRGDNGTYTVTVGTSPVADALNNTLVPDTVIGTFDVTVPVSTAHGPRIALGGQVNGSVLVLDPNSSGVYTSTATVAPLSFFTGNVRTAAADVNGDGFIDTIAISGPGQPTRFAVMSGRDNRTMLIGPTAPFAGSEGFTGGGFVAAADLDGDGRAEMVFTPDQGGGARVVIFSLPGNQVFLRKNFLGIDDPNFRGGARPALGDVNRDGVPDLAVSAGFLGGPRTALYTGTSLFGTPTRLVGDFFAFPGDDAVTLRNGVYVSIGDINGDGYGDLIFGGGPGGAPRVFIISGQLVAANNVAGAQANPIANFFVGGNVDNRSGVRVGTANADGDLKAELIVGSGENSPARIQIYLGSTFIGPGEPSSPQVLDLFNSAVLVDGVYVG